MKYGITNANGVAKEIKGDVIDARAALRELRETMKDGESVSVWSEFADGSRMTLETVTQPRIFDISVIMN